MLFKRDNWLPPQCVIIPLRGRDTFYEWPKGESTSDLENMEEIQSGWKAILPGNILPVSTGLMVVMSPLWVLTSCVQGAEVSTGDAVGMMNVTGATPVAGKVGCFVDSGRFGRTTTGAAVTRFVGHEVFSLYGHGPLILCWGCGWATGGDKPLYMWRECGGAGTLNLCP